MKILLYNWAQFDSAVMAGGGVTLYLRNVIEELLKRDDVEVYFLSSGARYGLFRRRPAIHQTASAYKHPRLKTFTLVNSPIKAPAHDSFYSISTWLRDTTTSDLIRDFINQNGPFDAFHIHNLEGVSANVLSLEKGPNLKRLFYTFHNYMPVCPQIELLYNEKSLCTDYHDGTRCVGCLGHQNNMHDLIAMERIGGFIKGRGLAGHPVGGLLFDVFSGTRSYIRAARNMARDLAHGLRTRFRYWHLRPRHEPGHRQSWRPDAETPPLHVMPLSPPAVSGDAYRQWREANGEALHRHADGIFAVSDLCRETALRFLPAQTRIETLPLPMDIEVSPQERNTLRAKRPESDGITLSFIGYAIPSKGLPFLIDALMQIDDPFYKENVDLLVVARIDPRLNRQLQQLRTKFRSVQILPGYARNQLSALSQKVDLNIVPSIWWETFNQVTVEMGLLGVPSLVSDRVGAKQTISTPEHFVFEAENIADFMSKLTPLVKNPGLRARFFDKPLQIPTMRDHVNLLIEHYAGEETKS
ncbi:glycosyltransferase family 4 protein [Ruegeria sp. 2012CJ41-6]|uniref:Glycosyltransferase family 4 protein n=1 Tax=Ruegeria spongiae TaxID=2942209 RepID=A0ABT0Q5V7_9RHOB|nr:glycosyltransferase family 4 protein [Ruegeria spongiae]MCL6285256.1 glycosyltransferase family 4 protein [Ruegeria spongiae]